MQENKTRSPCSSKLMATLEAACQLQRVVSHCSICLQEPGDPKQRLGSWTRAVQANRGRSPLYPHLDYSFRIALLCFLGLLLTVILKLAFFF